MDNEAKVNKRMTELEHEKYLAEEQARVGSQNLCSGLGQAQTQAPVDDLKARLLSQLDYAEDRLISDLAMVRDARRTLNWASFETLRALDQFTRIEQALRRY